MARIGHEHVAIITGLIGDPLPGDISPSGDVLTMVPHHEAVYHGVPLGASTCEI